jgi:hypothetical protein
MYLWAHKYLDQHLYQKYDWGVVQDLHGQSTDLGMCKK